MPLRNSLFARIADFQRDRGRLGRRHTAWDRRASRPRLELLEDRTLLSIVVVENSKDNGPGSLRDTIATAAAGDTIEFDLTPGHVTSPITLTSGELEITENLTIDGPGAGTLTISGDSNSRVFQVSGGVTATISGLTIKDGKAALSGGGIGNGGSLKLTDDVFTSNSATGAGGAIYNSAGSLFMTGCSVTGNKAADGDGGGIYVAAGMVTIQGSTIDNNNAGAQFGGGISNLGTLTVTNSTIANNSAADGGGIFNTFSSTLTATNSTICDNNSSVDGGGIFNFGSMTVTNSTIAGNSASQEGGGIVAINPGGIPVVVTFANTIIAGNSLIGPVAGEGPDFFGQVTNDLGYNLIGDASGSTGFTQPSDLLNVNPLLGPLQNNGGPTETVALLANSPAIDAGSNSIPGVTIPTTDQRGALRGPAGLNAGANVDIGAYEASSSYLVNTAADSNDVGTLRTAVGWANVSTNANPENISNPAPNTIVFDTSGVFSMPQTIALEPDLGTLMLNNSSIPESIVGPGAGVVAVSGNGASQVFQVDGGVTAAISGLTIDDGSAGTTNGGGIDNGGTLSLTNCTVSNSSSGDNGGGIDNQGTLTLTASTVSGNSATNNGGGIENAGTLMLVNSTIASNTADNGGGIENTAATPVAAGATMTSINSTIADNSAAGNGGGIDNGNGGSATLGNTIVAGNSSTGAGSGPDFGGTVTTDKGNNLIGDDSGSSGFAQPPDLLNVNPLLSLLGNYGGPTQTFALLPGSPAIDAGDNALIPAGITTDQRGLPRIVNGVVDIGAVESQGYTITVSSGNNQQADVNTNFASSLVVLVTANNVDDPVSGGVVTFTPPLRGASATFPGGSDTATINASGDASIGVAANTIAGSYSVSASATGATPTSFNLTNTPGAADKLVFVQQPTTTTYGNTISPAVTVEVEDQFNNLVNSTASITVTLQNNPTGATLLGSSVSAIGGIATFSDLTVSKVGTVYTLAATSTGLSDSPPSNSFNITPRPITVTAAANIKTYDGTTSASAMPTITSGGLASGDAPDFTEVYSTRNVGTGLTLTPSGTVIDGNGGNNYTYTFVPVSTGVITALALTITAVANTKTYDGTTIAAGIPTIISGSLQGTDQPSFTEVYSTRNVGTGLTLTPSGSVIDGNGGNNYTYTFVPVSTGVITALALTITAVANTKTYDGTTSAAGIPTIISGSLQGTDQPSFTEVYSTRNVGTGLTLTPSGTVIDGNGGNNYTYTFVPVSTGVITAEALTITAVANTKTYDGTTSAAGIPTIISGSLQGTDQPSFTEVYSTRNVGTGLTLTPSGSVIDGNGGNNYTYTFVPVSTGVITALALTITAVANTKTYDGTTSAAGIPTIISGSLQGTDQPDFTEVYSTRNVGTGLTLTPSGTVIDGNGGNNYTYTFVPVSTGVITAEALTITAVANTKTYDGTTSAAGIPTIISGSLQGTDQPSFNEIYSTRNVGTGLTLTPSGTVIDGNGGNNYTYTFVPVSTGVITALALTITAVANTKTYDGTTSAAGIPTIISGSLQGMDQPSFTEVYSTRNVGTGLTLTPSGTVIDGNGGNNYTYTFVPVSTGVITALALTITAVANTKTYDGTTSAAGIPTIISGSLQGTDQPSFTEVYSTRNVGTGLTLTPIGTVIDGNGGNNYTYTFVPVSTGVITALALTITAVANTKVYDGTTSAAGIPTIISGSLQGTDQPSFNEIYSTRNVGTSLTLTPSGTVIDGNGGNNYTYTFVPVSTGVITAEALTITAVANTKVYDGTTSAAGIPTIISGSLQGTDRPSFIETYSTPNVGTGLTLTPSGTVIDGNGGNNYTYTLVAVSTGVITAEALTITAVANTKTYDGTTSAAGIPTIISGSLQGTDRPSFNETYSTPNVGTGLTLTPSGTVIDGNGGNNYTYTFVAVSTGVITAKTSATTVAALASSSLDPSTYGQSVTFEAAVATTDCLPTAIAGTVAFYDGKPGAGGIEIGSPQAVTAGHASIATATLSAGMHAIYAVYSPDPSTGTVYTSAPLSQKVAAANALVTITLVSPGGGGDPFYTVLARVTTNVPGLVPTGTISFRVGRGRPQTRALSNGIAILERTRSRPVNQTFHVTFQGDRTLFVTSPAQRVL